MSKTVIKKLHSSQVEASGKCAHLSSKAFYKPHYGTLSAAFHRTLREHPRDESFLIERDGVVTAVVQCNISDDVLGLYGGPLEIHLADNTFEHTRQDAIQAISELKRVAHLRCARAIMLRTSSSNDRFGIVAARALALEGTTGVEIRTEIDLSMTEEDLVADMRTTHRQQLKWGRENLEIEISEDAHSVEQMLRKYRELHVRVSGRETRSNETWQAMLSWIQIEGRIVLGSIGGVLVGGSISGKAFDCCYYISGAYERDLFKHPLSHFLVFNLIKQSKMSGSKLFDVGVVYYDGVSSGKELNIQYFKRGFSNRTVNSFVWRIVK